MGVNCFAMCAGIRYLLMLAAFFPLVAEARTRPAPATTAATTKPAKIVYGKGRQIGTLANKRINESSGLASGRVNQGVLWTHNDSGDGPHLYAFNFKGEHLATCRISGAAASDWEDLCSFRRGNRDVLLVGDVGDNNRRRDHCTLYAVFEPRLGPRARKSKDRPYLLRSMRTIHYRYRQGPQDCESIAVDPTTQTIYIVTKVLFGRCRVYALPWPKGLARKPIVIEPVATLPIPLVTGMDISPDGRRAYASDRWKDTLHVVDLVTGQHPPRLHCEPGGCIRPCTD